MNEPRSIPALLSFTILDNLDNCDIISIFPFTKSNVVENDLILMHQYPNDSLLEWNS